MEGAGPAPEDRLRGALLLVLGVWLALRQVDGVLSYLQNSGSGGYGANDLYSFSPKELPQHVRDLLAVWEANRPVSHVAFYVYTVLDVAFVVLYRRLLLRLFRRLPEAPDTGRALDRLRGWAARVVLVLVLADLTEDAMRTGMVWSGEAPSALVWAAWLATSVKWAALVTVLLLLVRAWSAGGLAAKPTEWTGDSWWALWRLRIPALVLTLFGLVLVADPTGQVGDSFRRWFDSLGQFVVSAALTAVGVVVLGAAAWTTARRSVLADYGDPDRPPSVRRWAVAAAALAVAAVALGLPNLWGTSAVLGAAVAVELLWLAFGARIDPGARAARETRARMLCRETAEAPAEGREPEVRRLARGLSSLPVLALLLGLASAWTAPPVVLLALGDGRELAVLCAAGAVMSLALVPFLARAFPAALDALESGSAAPGRPPRRIRFLGKDLTVRPARLEYRHAAIACACLVLCAAAVLWPLQVPSFAGPVAITAVILALFVIVLGEGQRYGETRPPPGGLTFLGFSRVPVTLMLLVALVAASIFDDGSYHSVHLNREPAPEQQGIALKEAFGDWTTRNCADRGDSKRTVPMVFVAAQGGGIRAAYWTSSVLTDLFGAPAAPLPRNLCAGGTSYGQVFAMGGASGGSVGPTAYASRATGGGKRWYRGVMGDRDFVAVPVSWALLVDLPRALVGFTGPDRQRRFEEVWEREDPELRRDFFAFQRERAPLLMLSGTQVETGCRMNISLLRLTARPVSEGQGECAALLARRPSAPDGPDRRSPLRPSAPLTSDVLDYLCDRSFDRSTAALTSARFPYVSPSGQLSRCKGGRTSAVVDGGYAENTGGQPILNLWERLEPLVAAHNAKGGAPVIVPVFLDVDNHYSKAAKAGPGSRTRQLLVPPLTAARADKLDDRGVEQLANAAFSTALPGLPHRTCTVGDDRGQRFVRLAPTETPGVHAPLGWTLSRMSMDHLDRRREETLVRGPAQRLARLLARGTTGCSD